MTADFGPGENEPAKIFISYAAKDDAPSVSGTGKRGFVTTLHVDLDRRCAELGRSPNLFQPRRTGEPGRTIDDRAAAEMLRSSDFLIVVLSRWWIESDVCRDDLKAFVERRNAVDPAAHGPCIIIVAREQISAESQPEVLRDLVPHRFFEVTGDGVQPLTFFRYVRTLHELADDIVKRIRREERPRPAPTPRTNHVAFSVFAPPTVQPQSSFVLSVWASLDESDELQRGDPTRPTQRDEMLRRASAGGRLIEAGIGGAVRIPVSSDLTLAVELPGFIINEPVDTLSWEGHIANASFIVQAPGLNFGAYPGTVRVSHFGVPIARVVFEIVVGTHAAPQVVSVGGGRSIRSAFASYASADREEVLGRVQGIRAAGVDVFMDIVTLRAGELWEPELRRAIRERDVLYLFWSAAARGSEWVDREWRMALEEKGIDFVWPVPLVDPRDAPPPPELAGRHFNDVLLAQIEVERLRRNAVPRRPAPCPPAPESSSPNPPRAKRRSARSWLPGTLGVIAVLLVGTTWLTVSRQSPPPAYVLASHEKLVCAGQGVALYARCSTGYVTVSTDRNATTNAVSVTFQEKGLTPGARVRLRARCASAWCDNVDLLRDSAFDETGKATFAIGGANDPRSLRLDWTIAPP